MIIYSKAYNKNLTIEKFNTEPSARGWSITTNGGNITYGSNGINLSDNTGTTRTLTIIKNDINISELLIINLKAEHTSNMHAHSIDILTVKIYVNNILYDTQSGQLSYGTNDCTTQGYTYQTYTLIVNKSNNQINFTNASRCVAATRVIAENSYSKIKDLKIEVIYSSGEATDWNVYVNGIKYR